MLYKLIQTAEELKQEFIIFDRDYYTNQEYQSILDYFDTSELYELDVIAISCSLDFKEWKELQEEFGVEDYDYILSSLSEHTTILSYDDNKVLYFCY